MKRMAPPHAIAAPINARTYQAIERTHAPTAAATNEITTTTNASFGNPSQAPMMAMIANRHVSDAAAAIAARVHREY